jgi:hypothetical protein
MRRTLAVCIAVALAFGGSPLVGFAAEAPALKQAGTGTLRGTAQNQGGQTLASHTVRLRNVGTGQLVGSTTSNGAGAFSFTGLPPANYLVEIVDAAGNIVGTSPLTAVAAGATVSVTVTTAAAGAMAGAAGMTGTAILLTTAAAAAGVVAVVVVATRDDASPSK